MSRPKSKNVSIVAASSNYLGELNALFNSIDYWEIDTDVVLLSYKLPEDYLKRIQEVFDFNIKIIQAPEGEQIRMTAIERFRVACEEGKNYEAILLLDADIYFTANVDLYFDVASKGFIITSHNGMIIGFGKSYQRDYNVDLGVPDYPYVKVHSTVPIWLSPKDLDWFKALYDSREMDNFDDLMYLNVLGIKMGKNKRMLSLQAFQSTNIHHWSMKLETGLIRKGDLVLTGVEGENLSVHGKFSMEAYYKDLMKVMDGYLKDEGFTEKRHREKVLKSREIMLEEFMKYTYLCKLDLRDFIHIEWLEKKLKPLE